MLRSLWLLLASIIAALVVTSALHAEEASESPVFPIPQHDAEKRHATKIEAVKAHKYDLLLVGDSITQNLEKPEYKPVWERFFAPRNAIDLGYSGARTENILWNLTNGELEGQSPKVVTLLIGTNNSDDANYPVVHTAEQIAEGTAAIVKLLRERVPDAKILILRIYPRTNVYRKPDGKERGNAEQRSTKNQRAGELVARLADDKDVFFLDLNHVFLRLDGSIDPQLMPDLLHPSPEGALAMARAMEPTLARLFGDEPRVETSANSAVVPVSKLENDFYDWWQRHEAVLNARETDPEIVLIGDSITHLWGGEPAWTGRKANGGETFASTFGSRRVLNLGFGWDRTQNVLWRLDHGEFDGLHPKWAIVNIGTNNFAETKNARANTPAEIAEGVRETLLRLRAKSPKTRIILMGVFPRGEKPDDPMRAKIAELNALLSKFANGTGITFLDLTSKLLQPDGTISRETMGDFLHPAEKGYAIWGKAVRGILD
jgi:lysophospholipase L1-like esterase